MRLVQLSRAEHGALRVDPRRAIAAAATVHLVPLVLSELRRAAAHYPVFLAKDADTGQFYPAALLGLEPHENLYWDGDALDAGYVPLNLMRLPFYVGGGEEGGTGALCIDLDSSGLDTENGRELLKVDGSDSDYIASIHAILSQMATEREPTRAFVDRLLAHRLVTEAKLDIVFHDGSATVLTGLYSIDESALMEAFGTIRTVEDMIAMAAMVVSLEHVAGLVRRRNARLASEADWLSPVT